jgi:hypothetical protein
MLSDVRSSTQKFNHPLTIHRLVETCRASSSQRRETSNWTLQDMVTLTLILALMLTLGAVFMTGVVATQYEMKL